MVCANCMGIAANRKWASRGWSNANKHCDYPCKMAHFPLSIRRKRSIPSPGGAEGGDAPLSHSKPLAFYVCGDRDMDSLQEERCHTHRDLSSVRLHSVKQISHRHHVRAMNKTSNISKLPMKEISSSEQYV